MELSSGSPRQPSSSSGNRSPPAASPFHAGANHRHAPADESAGSRCMTPSSDSIVTLK